MNFQSKFLKVLRKKEVNLNIYISVTTASAEENHMIEGFRTSKPVDIVVRFKTTSHSQQN